MNSDEIYEIKTTWAIPAAAPTDSGVLILTTFFTKHPSNLQKFKLFKDIPVSELKDNVRFRAHAINIINIFDESIKSLGFDRSGTKLEEIWSKVAKSHLKRKIEKQAYNELREIVLEVLAEVCKLNEKQTAAWVKLMDIVYGILFRTVDKLQSEAK